MITPQDLAQRYNLRTERTKKGIEWHGANPWDASGAQEDGFWINADGTACDRKLGGDVPHRYSSFEVARLSGLTKEDYEPCARWLSTQSSERPAGNGRAATVKASPIFPPNLNPKPAPKPASKPAPKAPADTRSLIERGYTLATLQHFGITTAKTQSEGEYYDYPTHQADGAPGRRRRKYREAELSKKKYKWLGAGGNEPPGYNLDALIGREESTEVWCVNGEPAVWCAHQNGILAVSPFGEKRNLDQFLDALMVASVKRLCLVPDNDSTGRKAALLLLAQGAQRGIEVLIYEWPLPASMLPTGYDLCDFWEAEARTGSPLADALARLVPAEIENWPESPRMNREAVKSKPRSVPGLGLGGLGSGAPETPVKGAPKPKARALDTDETDAELPAPAPPMEQAGKRVNVEEQTARLLDILNDESRRPKLFGTEERESMLSILVQGQSSIVRECVEVGTEDFRYLSDELYTQKWGGILKKEALETTARVMSGTAMRQGEKWKVSPRVMSFGRGTHRKVYLDLGNRSREMVEISADGWRLVSWADGVHFRRAQGTMALPFPVSMHAGRERDLMWEQFHELLGAGSDRNWHLMVSWMLSVLRGSERSCVALAVSGEQDSGKTLKTKMLRQMVDPNLIALGDLPREPRDLNIMAKNRFVLGFDNLSGVSGWLSDAFCRIATDGTFSTRKLHTDSQEQLFFARRPLVFNGIAEFMGKDDFKRRCIFVGLERFGRGGTKKKSEEDVWDAYKKLAPRVMGALLDAASAAIAYSNATELNGVADVVGGGFVDFAHWICGAELGGTLPWNFGDFMGSYTDSQNLAAEAGMEALLPMAITNWLRTLHATECDRWVGTSRDLHEALELNAAILSVGVAAYQDADINGRIQLAAQGRLRLERSKEWPSTEAWLSRDLRRLAPRLRRLGLCDVVFQEHPRTISIQLLDAAKRSMQAEAAPFGGAASREELDLFDD